jgi:hypothetical protein
MRTRHQATLADLRRAIDCLPRRTRIAMLEGMHGNEIIVGAYANDDGICPMLAAHRSGGRTSAISFARAWDRFAFRDARAGRARRATERELLILRSQLEASLLDEETPAGALAAARREHSDLVAKREHSDLVAKREHSDLVARRELSDRLAQRESDRRSGAARRPGDPNRTAALRDRPGWAWTRIVRRYDDYERVLARLEQPAPPTTESEKQPA